jgi:large subunit ribosomal protein L6
MSRIGKKEILVPAGVEVTIDTNTVTVKGPKGTLTEHYNPIITVKCEGNVIKVTRSDDEKISRSLHGTTRTVIANMVTGVTEGFSKKLEIVGVGYKSQLQGKDLVLSLGYSHPVIFKAEEGITYEVPDSNTVVVKGIEKQVVGARAAEIRGKRPPEPYHGKGVKYSGEKIRRKAGKTGK